MTAALGLVVTAGVLAAAGSGPRRITSPDRPRPTGRASWAMRLMHGSRQPREGHRPAGDDLVGVLTTVCSLVRAGSRPADAWARALRLPSCGTVPTVEQVLSGSSDASRGRLGRPSPGQLGRARAVVAAAAVAAELGTPLATVLDDVADAVVADAEAEAELAAALAGPRASVRVLIGLPVLGVLLGAALGADPLGVLLGGGLGTASGLLGGGLVVAGWCWTRALVARARRASS